MEHKTGRTALGIALVPALWFLAGSRVVPAQSNNPPGPPGLASASAASQAGQVTQSGVVPAPSETSSLANAEALLDHGKLDQAIVTLQEIARRSPDAPGLNAALGKAYYQKREFETASKYLEVAVRQNPNDGESTQLLGLCYHLMGHLERAIPLLEKVQSWLPKPDVTGSYLLGIDYLQNYQDDKARVAFARMFSVPPDSAQAHVVLAEMMIRQEFEEKAIPELKKAIEMDPSIPMAHFMLGEMYLFKSQPQLAIEEFQRELTKNPVLWLAYWRLGDAYDRLDRPDQAETALRQSVWLNPDFTGPYILLGKVELKRGDPALAASFLEKALKMDPSNSYAHYILGEAYQKLGRTAEADHEFALTQSLRHNDK